ncbi:hypothetical protein HPP92_014860 [Vanilla planifolia]|uniref:VQ domain-containing protein n=1 Tax=Vanilla planifolia TaxID=51239 RepID=A0A835UT49_VANPL|nr:hypothetical protein HPP92_014860 [Vanilla planifolia]
MDHNAKNHQLGVNKLGKSIRKSPLHQTGFQRIPPLHHQHPPPQLPQPQVYNISKSDFRSVVQQLTGSPSRDPAVGNLPMPSRPVQQKLPSSRLMKIRPPPLTPIARPPPPPFQNTVSNPNPIPNINSNGGFHPRPAPSPTNAWAESPVSAYMRYLQSSLLSSDSSRQIPAQGLLPSPLPPTAAALPVINAVGFCWWHPHLSD